jgi:death-on-curing family protein
LAINRKKIIKYISVADVEFSALQLAREFMEWGEPIPDFSTRFPDTLERCLANIRQTYNGKDLYPTLGDKVTMLFYTLIKDHPFQNGNKRLAVMSILFFLVQNNKWLKIEPKKLYKIAVLVAKSSPEDKDLIVEYISFIIKQNMVKYKLNS